ncbi:hypothetical protein ACIBHY_21210 [Nonomuraea sp. NPDC050547]
MFAMVLLIMIMVITVTSFELCMRCSRKSEESVEPQAEIAGD